MAMNGGIFHAVEGCDDREFDAAEAGYRYFGLPQIAALMIEARELIKGGEDVGEFERPFGKRYATVLPSDAALAKQFEAHYRDHPDAYSPMQ
jgi:hypothetical protein